jgi:peptide/nickel transport system permease protein
LLRSPSDEQRAEIADDLGISDPLPVRYVHWLGDFVTGDLGKTYSGPTLVHGGVDSGG